MGAERRTQGGEMVPFGERKGEGSGERRGGGRGGGSLIVRLVLLYVLVLSLTHTNCSLYTHPKIPYNDVTYLNYAGVVLNVIVSMP